jgi:hypothetical protein
MTREQYQELARVGLRDPDCDWCWHGDQDGICTCARYRREHGHKDHAKYIEMPTPLVLDMHLLPGDNWIAKPGCDARLVPEAEYEKIVGRVN